MDTEFGKFSGDIPAIYEHCLGPTLFVDYARELADRLAKTTPKRVLELAAGTGILTRMLRQSLAESCELIATDLSEPMLATARQKIASKEQLSFRQADAMALPFEDASFDAIACQFGVMFFPDKDRSYREAFRVLKPHGHYIFSAWSSFAQNPFASIAQATAERFFADDPPSFYHLPFSYTDSIAIEASLRGAGFSTIAFDLVKLEKTVTDYDRFAQGLVLGNPMVEEIRSRSKASPEAVQVAVATALREAFGDEPSAMPIQALVVTASRGA